MKILSDISNLTFVQIVVFGSVLTGVFYFSFYDKGTKLMEQIENTNLQIQQTEATLQKKQNEIDRLIQFEKDLAVDEKSINVFLDYISTDMTTIDMFRLVTREAKMAGVNIEDKRDQGMDEQEMLDVLKTTLKISGSFSQIVFFLSKLTAQKRILLVDRIQVESREKKELVIASMDIYAFRYKPSASKEDKKKEGS